jgi:SAM-dependent methyltransferase
LAQIVDLCENIPKTAWVIDFGCGGLYVLKLLYAMGFRNLVGIDLALRPRDYLESWLYARRRGLYRAAFKLVRGDIARTTLAPDSFDVGICLSVIEHRVPVDVFFEEASRILRNGAPLFVSTDYWENTRAEEMNGVPWTVYSRDGVTEIVRSAKRNCFHLVIETGIPGVNQRIYYWGNFGYTFLSMHFELRRGESTK